MTALVLNYIPRGVRPRGPSTFGMLAIMVACTSFWMWVFFA